MKSDITITLTSKANDSRHAAYQGALAWDWHINYGGEEFSSAAPSFTAADAGTLASEKVAHLTKRDDDARKKANAAASRVAVDG